VEHPANDLEAAIVDLTEISMDLLSTSDHPDFQASLSRIWEEVADPHPILANANSC
jgi:hypothetical protein